MSDNSFVRHTRIARSKSRGIVYIIAKWNANKGNLSVNGVEGPLRNGNCMGSCGQIVLHEWSDYTPEDGIELDKIRDLWDRWHLNDMRAGDTVQEAWLRSNGRGENYFENCEKLKSVGLYNHEGYKYGYAWKREEVPTHVVEYFRQLPESGTLPQAWRD